MGKTRNTCHKHAKNFARKESTLTSPGGGIPSPLLAADVAKDLLEATERATRVSRDILQLERINLAENTSRREDE